VKIKTIMEFNSEEIKSIIKEAKELKDALVYLIKTGEMGTAEFSKLNNQLNLLKENLKLSSGGMNLFKKMTFNSDLNRTYKNNESAENGEKLKSSLVNGFNQSLEIAKQIRQLISSGGNDIISSFSMAFSIVKGIVDLMKTIDTAASLLSLIPGGGIFSVLFKASGGMIPGTGSSDTVPAWLTPGEFVIRKSAVQKYGTGFFEALNNSMMNSSLFNKYAGGGLVRASAINKTQTIIPDVRIKGKDIVLVFNRANNSQLALAT
jgi:hypothetical protein